MKVYVFEGGSYNDRVVTAVFSSLIDAQRGYTDWKLFEGESTRSWTRDGTGSEESSTITEIEVDEAVREGERSERAT